MTTRRMGHALITARIIAGAGVFLFGAATPYRWARFLGSTPGLPTRVSARRVQVRLAFQMDQNQDQASCSPAGQRFGRHIALHLGRPLEHSASAVVTEVDGHARLKRGVVVVRCLDKPARATLGQG
jgi:hypothetical protein